MKFWTLALVLTLSCCSACSRTVSTLGPTRVLVVGETQEPRSLNPLLLEGAMSALIGPTVYSHLLTVDSSGNLEPDLAEAVPALENGGISPDRLTITYRLRPGLHWQDGKPLTAADVVFTYDAIMNPLNEVPSRWAYDQVASVRALDRRTVQVRMKRVYSPILTSFFAPDQNYQILPRHLLATYVDVNRVPFDQEPVGSGPFRVASWYRGDNLDLRANAYDYAGSPDLSEIRLRFVPDSNTLLEQLRTGEIQAAFGADPYHLPEYETLPNVTVRSTPIMGFEALLFNLSDPVIGDVRVRRAIAESLDIATLVRDATRGTETARDAGRGFFSWAYDPSIPGPRYDVRDAARLLEEAGWMKGSDGIRVRNGRRLELRLAFGGGNAAEEQLATIVQQRLRAAGIQLDVRRYAQSQFIAPGDSGGPLFGGKFQLAVYGALRSVDPNDEWVLGCDQFPPHGFNVTRYCNAEVAAADAADAATYDRGARLRDMRVIQRRVAEDLPFVTLWQRRVISVYPAWLHGVSPSPLSSFWNVGAWRISSRTKGSM